AWYLLKIRQEGELRFEIVPTDTTNDYDFLIYPYRDTGFCQKLLERKLIPVRSNISNTLMNRGNGTTGLSPNATQSFHGQGEGHSFSAPLQVKNGDRYMLVLDNVTPQGNGHI